MAFYKVSYLNGQYDEIAQDESVEVEVDGDPIQMVQGVGIVGRVMQASTLRINTPTLGAKFNANFIKIDGFTNTFEVTRQFSAPMETNGWIEFKVR